MHFMALDYGQNARKCSKKKNVHPYEVCVPFVTNFFNAVFNINWSVESVKSLIKQNWTRKSVSEQFRGITDFKTDSLTEL